MTVSACLAAPRAARQRQSGRLDDLQAGSTELGTGAGDLSGNLQKLKTGSAQVSAGASQLAEQAPALTSGIQQLSDGSDTLAAGTGSMHVFGREMDGTGIELSHVEDGPEGAPTILLDLDVGLGEIDVAAVAPTGVTPPTPPGRN